VGGRDHCLDLPAVVKDGAGEDLVGAIGQARQPGHLVLARQRHPDRLFDQPLGGRWQAPVSRYRDPRHD